MRSGAGVGEVWSLGWAPLSAGCRGWSTRRPSRFRVMVWAEDSVGTSGISRMRGVCRVEGGVVLVLVWPDIAANGVNRRRPPHHLGLGLAVLGQQHVTSWRCWPYYVVAARCCASPGRWVGSGNARDNSQRRDACGVPRLLPQQRSGDMTLYIV